MRARAFVTSRPDLPIRLGFNDIKGKYQDLALHEIPKPIIEHDILVFLDYQLAKIIMACVVMSINFHQTGQAIASFKIWSEWPSCCSFLLLLFAVSSEIGDGQTLPGSWRRFYSTKQGLRN